MSTLVVGVGNDDRGDDGLGPLAARLLAETLAPPRAEGRAEAGGDHAGPPPGVQVIPWTGDPLGLLDRWDGVDRLVLIDAVVSGAAPGTTRRYGPDAPFARTAEASTHGLGIAEALALGRALGRLPGRIEVWGIEAVEFAAGAPLTPAVAEAVLALVARLGEELGEVAPRTAQHAGGAAG
ncbi:MAG: hydrogenase maturation protease [Trueperaceae bacterium]